MDEIKISICIPMYNSEISIRKTLDSLISLTIFEKEIVIIDDGSTDASSAIVEEYILKYPYIKYIYQENQGVSIARQTAVNNSSGKYIAFVDADDTVEKDIFQLMVQIAESNNYDMVECRAEQNGILYNDYDEEVFCGIDKIKNYFVEYQLKRPLWLRIYNRKLFSSDTFPKMRLNNEDVFVFPCLLVQANRCYIMPKGKILYHYADNNDQSVVNQMKVMGEKTYRKVLLFAKVPLHFETLLKGEKYNNIIYSKEYRIFCGRFYTQILTRKYIKNTYEECMADLISASNKTQQEIRSCILEYLMSHNVIVYITAKIIGLKALRKICFLFR